MKFKMFNIEDLKKIDNCLTEELGFKFRLIIAGYKSMVELIDELGLKTEAALRFGKELDELGIDIEVLMEL